MYSLGGTNDLVSGPRQRAMAQQKQMQEMQMARAEML